MGFQSGLLAMAGSVAGAVGSIKKTLQQRQEEAIKKVKENQAAQKKQRRNFKEYLKQQPIAGGGNVGQLPPTVINALAKQYTPSQRKKLMDTMDKEKMNKNGK